MSESSVIKCQNCGAPLAVELNRAYLFCQYCGCKNVIHSEQIQTELKIGSVEIKAKTDFESMLSTIEYFIDAKNYEKADEMISAAILTGNRDYRLYIQKAMLNLQTDDNASLFSTLNMLKRLEENQQAGEVTEAIRRLMSYRGKNGVQPLHIATFHEDMEQVEFCVDHGSDLNSIAGMNRVTPISIMFVPISKNSQKLDGTPFIRNKAKVKQIRRYLLARGAHDKFRLGY